MKPFAFCVLAAWLHENKKSQEGFRSSVSRAYFLAKRSAKKNPKHDSESSSDDDKRR